MIFKAFLTAAVLLTTSLASANCLTVSHPTIETINLISSFEKCSSAELKTMMTLSQLELKRIIANARQELRAAKSEKDDLGLAIPAIKFDRDARLASVRSQMAIIQIEIQNREAKEAGKILDEIDG